MWFASGVKRPLTSQLASGLCVDTVMGDYGHHLSLRTDCCWNYHHGRCKVHHSNWHMVTDRDAWLNHRLDWPTGHGIRGNVSICTQTGNPFEFILIHTAEYRNLLAYGPIWDIFWSMSAHCKHHAKSDIVTEIKDKNKGRNWFNTHPADTIAVWTKRTLSW